jgi:hypothetical protein
MGRQAMEEVPEVREGIDVVVLAGAGQGEGTKAHKMGLYDACLSSPRRASCLAHQPVARSLACGCGWRDEVRTAG